MRHRLHLSGIEQHFRAESCPSSSNAELSLVIPVYNGSRTIGPLIEEICTAFAHLEFEIVLVNDGSSDDSERICANLVRQHPDHVIFLQLTRNFGEHNAVMAGLKHAGGDYIAILDDDGQHAVQDVDRMYMHAKERHCDVVYSRYGRREHSWFRRLGSWFNDRAANIFLKKPTGLYLSSFKVMNRAVVDEVIRYAGPFPYLDGLILRVTRNIGQLDVTHLPRQAGESGYTLSKLVGLWLNMSVGFSLAPLRCSVFAGLFTILSSMLIAAAATINKLWLDPGASLAMPCLVAAVICAIGVQLVALGIVGEYVGRTFLHQSGMPQNVVRYVRQGNETVQPYRQDSVESVTG